MKKLIKILLLFTFPLGLLVLIWVWINDEEASLPDLIRDYFDNVNLFNL